ncbi:TetR family transcriptional regulator [Nocardioides psychrotolerans]|uniref:TetR/AcrR family transcriptional regulator n=1 Tax=Nocardioides psychrotolerans TaxID=1005945 RepID=UPI000B813589|nr:TetR/AcrR family transcriptional regulator [Nocardioides psychrotolerans]GEP40299.1 TetR family transcriptional regulator [Nocardioides psychrotolerans]
MSSQVSSIPRREPNARQTETAERLLAAGAEELREVGVEALTIRTVALRAGVSAATAYTYLSSKNHLFAELFLRHLTAEAAADTAYDATDATSRVQQVTRRMTTSLATEPALAAGATQALLGTDPDVERLRLRIGAEFVERFKVALGEKADPVVLETLTLAFSGALLQAGMGLMTYTEMGERLDAVVAVILKGNQ